MSLHRGLRKNLSLNQLFRCRMIKSKLFQRVILTLGPAIYGVLLIRGWYKSFRGTTPPPKPESEKTPVVIVATSKAEAEEIAELLGDKHRVVGYIRRTRYDILRDES